MKVGDLVIHRSDWKVGYRYNGLVLDIRMLFQDPHKWDEVTILWHTENVPVCKHKREEIGVHYEADTLK